MQPAFPRITRSLALVPAVLLLFAGCAYFNTYYNAQSLYKEGLKLKGQAQVVQSKAKFEKSIEKSAMVISRWPKSAWVDDATFLIGMSYYEMGSYDKAIRHFEQLVLAFPTSGLVPRAELYRGLALLGNKSYGTAGVVLGGVRRRYPRLADVAAFHLADAYYTRKEYARAVDSLGVFVERFPRSRHALTAMLHLAESNFLLENWDEAERWYDRSVRQTRDPKMRAASKLKMAATRLSLGKYDEAVQQVRDVLGRYPDLDDEAYLLMGRALAGQGRSAEALDAWSHVRGANALGAEAFFRMGKFHEEQKEFELARAHYDTSVSRRANSDYGVLAVKRLSLLDALAERDSSEREPAETMFLLAEVHNLNLGDYDEAMRLYQAVYDSFPDSDWAPKALFARAWILRRIKGDTVQMTGVLDTIIDGYPDTEYADESRRWLGLPVPKRAPKKVEVPKPDTVAMVPDTVATAQVPPAPMETEEDKLEEEARRREEKAEAGPGRLREPRPPTPVLADTAPPAEPSTLDEETPARPEPGEPPVREEKPRVVEEPARPGEPAKPAEPVVLETVHFDFDRWDVRQQDLEILERNARALARQPEARVEVVGHCDPRGPEEYNRALGMKRAYAVKEFLVGQGVADDRVSVRSEGEGRPISTTPEEYWLDRRAEFLVR